MFYRFSDKITSGKEYPANKKGLIAGYVTNEDE